MVNFNAPNGGNARMHIGMSFDTPFETGCVVVTLPDSSGNFTARDSEGVECEFNTAMIERTY